MSVANKENTEQRSKQFPHVPYKTLGKTQLQVSEVGFGSYRIEENNDEHQEALETALLHGINLIDTSSNYNDGGSERLIGHVLNDFIYKQQCKREEIVVVSKAGYIQGSLWEYLEKNDTNTFKDVVKLDYGLSHCIHPSFLKEQLSHMLERLDLATLDVFLLHNPEYYLIDAKRKGINPKDAQAIYIQRIKESFDYLEEEIKDGRICHYGISSNTFGYPKDHPEFTPLEELISEKHPHFSVIQCPLNIFESGALLDKNQSQNNSCITLAHQHNIGILTNRPLNAYHKNKLICLRDIPSTPQTTIHPQNAIQAVIDLEKDVESIFKLEEKFEKEEDRLEIAAILHSGDLINTYWPKLQGLEEVKQLFSHIILPRLEHAIIELTKKQEPTKEEHAHIEHYIQQVNTCAEQLIHEKRQKRSTEIKQIKQMLTERCHASKHQPLSQIAINCLRSCPEISCILVGMRQQNYVNETIETMQLEKIKNSEKLWNELHKTFTHSL